MARGPPTAEPSDFEKQRLANIAERDALLKKLTLEANQGGLFAGLGPASSQIGTKRPAKRKERHVKRVKKEEDLIPRRTSSRLRGMQADSEIAQQRAEEEYERAKEVERTRRQRVTGDLSFADGSLIGADTILKGVARPYERTFDENDIKETTDKEVKKLRQKMSGLELWDAWEPNRIKLTTERIYTMAFHPATTKPIVFAGDKQGHLGIIDASQRPSTGFKQEEDVKVKKEPREAANARRPGDTNPEASEEGEGEEDSDPVITMIKPHTRTISAMHTHPSKPETLYTASYDSSIRATDLQKSVAVEIYGPADVDDDEPVSGIDMAATDPHVLYFTTLNGAFGRYDTREAPTAADLYQLSDKKIGGFSLNPVVPHYVATASLDRFMRLWDLRKITKRLPTLVGEHQSRLSVSHAAFNTAGQVATASYDDTIKIHSFGVGRRSKTGANVLESMSHWKPGFQLDDQAMEPEVIVRHNNQTGRWVTILKPHWQRHPQDNVQKLVIGNMNRFIDIYSADGMQLAQLGSDTITAVPAVAVFHPTHDWIAGGTASGKLCLWM